jgi:hypothetical protein
MSLGHKHTFDKSEHKLSFNPDFNMFQIDETLVPVSSIREVLTEGPASSSIAVSSHAEPKDVISQPEIENNWFVAVPDHPPKEVKLVTKSRHKKIGKLVTAVGG